jgi:hypothetical protein
VRLSEARAVLAYSRDLALAVRDGTESLDDAYATVRAERSKLDTKEAKIAQLRKDAPDLADLVAEDRMKLAEAVAAATERANSLQRQRKLVAEEMARALDFFVQDNVNAETRAEQIITLFDVTQATAEMKQMLETLAFLIAHAGKAGAAT